MAERIENYPLHKLRNVESRISQAEAEANLRIFVESIEERRDVLFNFIKQNAQEFSILGDDIFSLWPWIFKYSGYCLGAYPREPHLREIISFGSGWPYAPGLIAMINDFSAILGSSLLEKVPSARWVTSRNTDAELPKELRYYKIGTFGMDDSSNAFFDAKLTEIQDLTQQIFTSSFYRFSERSPVIDAWSDINYLSAFISDAKPKASPSQEPRRSPKSTRT